jgi:ABC transporter substrate binding protein
MQFDRLIRREFITLLGGAVAAWPLATRAQQAERMRRIGVLLNRIADDPEGRARFTAFVQGLQQLGWADGRNVRMDVRWAGGVDDHFRKYAAELVALVPDVILTDAAVGVAALQHTTRTVPIVFVTVADPVGAGFVKSLARPGGNSTGFASFEYSVAGKWLELLKEITPRVTRAAVLRDPTIAVCRKPSGGTDRDGVERGRYARRRRDRARRRGICTWLERWADCDGRAVWGKSSRCHGRVGRPLQAARCLPLPLFRQRRGAYVIWARPREPVSPRGRLCRSHSQRGEGG